MSKDRFSTSQDGLRAQIASLKETIVARKSGDLPEEHSKFGAWITEETLLLSLERQLERILRSKNKEP